jgi:formylglycine-generating enzyme required for sulfatase activity
MAIGSAAPALAEKRYVMGMPEVAPGSVSITGEYWALIIGIDKYTHAPSLETAVKDATGVRDVLLTRYGFKRERIIELLDEQATRTGIEEMLYKLSRQAGAEDSVFIYYAGHGQYEQDGRLGWWVPVEGKPQSPGTFITNASIRDYIEGMKAKHIYLVADSCFSGTLFGRTRAMPPLNDQFFSRLYANRSRWGLTSGGTEPVADLGKAGHSIFAYHFIKLLQENTNPYLVPSHIFDQIAPIIANNSDQTPRSEPLKGAGDEGGQFVFRLAAGMATVTPSASGVGRKPKASAPSAALSQAEQELKALEDEERKVEEQQKLAEFQAQIATKKQQIEEKKQQQVMASIPSPSLSAQPREIRGKDGAPMLLIPAGEFMMGSTDGDPHEKPVHKVSLDAFYLDKHEVTNRLFQKFTHKTGYETTAEKEGEALAYVQDDKYIVVSGANWRTPEGGETIFTSNRDEHPVVSVSWHDAVAYCRWAGKRLPTEAEFEYTLRAGTTTTYWWGDGNPDSRRVANILDESAKPQFPGYPIMTGYDDGYARTAPVGSFEPNPFGLHDMIGNVWEWTADWYNSDYYQRSPGRSPTGPSSGSLRVVRGGSWGNEPKNVRAAARSGADPRYRHTIGGFRCAQDAR